MTACEVPWLGAVAGPPPGFAGVTEPFGVGEGPPLVGVCPPEPELPAELSVGGNAPPPDRPLELAPECGVSATGAPFPLPPLSTAAMAARMSAATVAAEITAIRPPPRWGVSATVGWSADSLAVIGRPTPSGGCSRRHRRAAAIR